MMGIQIVRVEIHRTKGYQVRYGDSLQRGYNSRFFSDSVWGGKRKAREKARELYERILQENSQWMPVPYDTFLQRNNTSGKTGVNLYTTVDRRYGTDKVRVYWEATYHYMKDGEKVNGHKRFGHHTYGEGRAKELAIEFRKGWEEVVRKGYDEVDKFVEAFNEHLHHSHSILVGS